MTRRQLLTIAAIVDSICWLTLGFLVSYSLGAL
jgi:hypothetical protein